MYQGKRQFEIRHLECWISHQSAQFERTIRRITALRTVTDMCYLTIAIRLSEE